MADILDGEDVDMTLDIPDKGQSTLWSTKFSQEDDEDEVDKLTGKKKTPKEIFEGEDGKGSDTLNPDITDNKAAFTEYYLGLMTGGNFGEDLNKIRESNDFNNQTSMPLLIAALKEGVNMFDKEQRDLILSANNN